jgi:hypothetical protein
MAPPPPPPPVGPPPMGLMSPDMFRAVVPPAKKQRAGATPPIHGVSQQQPFGSTATTERNVPDDVARRRAELALLEEKMNKSVLNRGSAPPPRPPPPAPPLPMDRVRHSDIFPSVQKSAAELNPIDTAPLSPGSMGGSITPLPPPIISPRSAESLATSPVARRLDAAFESNPLRPPPPPPLSSSVTPAPPSRPKSAPLVHRSLPVHHPLFLPRRRVDTRHDPNPWSFQFHHPNRFLLWALQWLLH